MTSIVLQISKVQCKPSEACSMNYASPEPEPVLTHLRALRSRNNILTSQTPTETRSANALPLLLLRACL